MSSSGFFSSSIGKKYVMGITGLGLSAFILSHVSANLLILFSAEAYNRYSHALVSNKLIYLAEAGLLAIFLAHVFLAIRLTIENRAARPERYAMKPNGEKGVYSANQTMIHQGMIILVFTVLHLITFKYGKYYEVTYGTETMRDLHRLVVEVFHEPGYVAWYCFALLVLGYHLSHGFQSAFQSLGINHPSWTPKIKALGWLFTIFVTLGFLIQPLYVLIFT